MTALVIIGLLVLLLIGSKTTAGQELLSQVTSNLAPVTWYVPTQADLTAIVNKYRSNHDKYWQYLFNTCQALQITPDLFNPASSFCQAVGYGVPSADPTGASLLISQKLGEGIQTAQQGAQAGLAIGQAAEGASFAGTAVSGALKAIPIVGTFASVFLTAFNFISQKHAAAVKKENLVSCPAVPQINQAFAQVGSQLRARQITGAQALAMLNQLRANAAQIASADPSSGAVQLWMDGTNGIVDTYALIIQNTGV